MKLTNAITKLEKAGAVKRDTNNKFTLVYVMNGRTIEVMAGNELGTIGVNVENPNTVLAVSVDGSYFDNLSHAIRYCTK